MKAIDKTLVCLMFVLMLGTTLWVDVKRDKFEQEQRAFDREVTLLSKDVVRVVERLAAKNPFDAPEQFGTIPNRRIPMFRPIWPTDDQRPELAPMPKEKTGPLAEQQESIDGKKVP